MRASNPGAAVMVARWQGKIELGTALMLKKGLLFRRVLAISGG